MAKSDVKPGIVSRAFSSLIKLSLTGCITNYRAANLKYIVQGEQSYEGPIWLY